MLLRNQKGQGLTEYGIILLLICALGLAVYNYFNIKDNLQAIYGTVATDLDRIAGFDTGEVIYVPVKNATTGKTDNVAFHATRLAFEGKTIYWFQDSNSSTKQYTNDGTSINSAGWMNYATSPKSTFYFKGDDGNYYSVSANGSDLERYTGDVSFMGGSDYGTK